MNHAVDVERQDVRAVVAAFLARTGRERVDGVEPEAIRPD
jgi:hypothetical protein